jgi:heme/copper-type cytochrome/quinol oxidase subunit 3
MEIPYTVRPRPDTGLTNPKLGIWLFLASEVMLFGGLFAGYIFMRVGAEPWMWPTGWLNVPVGTFNTFILIFSSVTIILSWEALKMRNYKAYKMWLLTTWLCGLAFLTVKLAYEWPDKFHHFGAYIKKEAAHEYEKYLGNENKTDEKGNALSGFETRKGYKRLFIGGHAHNMKQSTAPFLQPAQLDNIIAIDEKAPNKAELEAKRLVRLQSLGMAQADIDVLIAPGVTAEKKAEILHRQNHIHLESVDAENANPYDPGNDSAHFWHRDPVPVEHLALNKEHLIPNHGAFTPKLNTYLSCYFMITGLHGLHVLGGVIVFFYFWLNIAGGSKLYKTNHQQLVNRIEVAGLFWHLVDLIWIFVFPIFYLL